MLKSTIFAAPPLILAAAAAFVSAPLAAEAAPTTMHTYKAVALSPGGDRVAYVETVESGGAGGPTAHGHIVLRTVTGARVGAYDPCPTCNYNGLAWSPDGRALAVIASDGVTSLATLDVLSGGRARPLATLSGVAQAPRWSPDGASIALLAVAGAHKQTGAVEAGAAQVGVIDAVQVQDEQRIAVVPAAGGPLRYVSPADTFVYEYDWTPDGRGFVATAAKGNGDNNWWVAKLVAVDLASDVARTIAEPKFQMNMPKVSPDGRSVSLIGGLMSDFGSIGGDVYTVPFVGGDPVDVTPDYKGTFTSLVQRPDALYATALIGDRQTVLRLDPVGRTATALYAAPATLEAQGARVSLSADGRAMAAAVESFETAPHIVAGPLDAPVAVSHDNDALPPQTRATSVHWKSDGFDVQAWLLAPLNVAPGKHPMVVEIHGGPSAAATPRYVAASDATALFPLRDLLARGYFVFQPNPRGSYGQGEAFTRANVRDFGGGDLRDILAGVDAVERTAPVDDARLGVLGHSYGGFMTMWTVTHSHRFHAAVAGAGLSDWISYYGENGIDQWMIPFFGASAYDDPAIYEKLSPIFAIKDATTPTMIYVGERDVECPAPQSFEFWHGLKAVGVPTSLIVYAGQGHAIRDPADLADLRKRQLGWLEKYLGR